MKNAGKHKHFCLLCLDKQILLKKLIYSESDSIAQQYAGSQLGKQDVLFEKACLTSILIVDFKYSSSSSGHLWKEHIGHVIS